jgi:hypothetical protein
MNSSQIDEAVVRARRLVDLYDRKQITANTLVSEVASLATPDNVKAVMGALSPKAQGVVRNWVSSLREEDGQRIVFWPLSTSVRLSFKEWLHEEERSERARQSEN